MNRRRYLTAVGGTVTTLLLAGCVSDDSENTSNGAGNDTDDGDTDGTSPDQNGSGTGTSFSVSPMSFENEDSRPFSYSATVVTDQFDTSAGPLTVTIELTNTTDDAITFGEARTALFDGTRSAEEQFALYPGSSEDIDEEIYRFDDTCWHRTTDYLRTSEYQTQEIEAGASVDRTFVLAVGPNQTCPEPIPESISFSTEVTVWEAAQPVDVDGGTGYEWGFSLTQE
jgi:hypothetical protein